MSHQNVEIVRRMFHTIDQSGWEAVFASGEIHQDCELTFKSGPQAGTHKGLVQAQAVIADLQAGFASWMVEPLEVIESGERVVAIVNNRLRPKGGESGEFEYRNGFVYTISDGLIVSVVGYPTPAEALEAAGLEE
jgi:ketosteroid isomerase-like protein